MSHHGGVLRRSAVLLPAVCLVLTGCVRLEAPAAESALAGATEPALRSMAPPADAAAARLEPECPPADPDQPLTADDMNEAFLDLDLPDWKQADVGTSAVLSDGRVVWVWGDTVREADADPRMADNSILVSSGTCISQLVTPDRGPVLPPDPDELSVWPLSAVRVDPRPGDADDVTDVLIVFCSRVQREDGQFDFIERGSSVAVYTVGADGVPRLTESADLTLDDPNLGAIHWGAASAVDGDWVYVYGTRSTGEAYVYGRELYVARMQVTEVMDGTTMEYWDGTSWTDDRSRTAAVLGAVDGVSQRLSVDLIDGRWVAFSKFGGDFGDVAAVWTSDRPTGPFTAEPVLDAPFGADTGVLQYMPLAHPDVPTEPGTMLVSVSRNLTEFFTLLKRPELALPLFSQIPRP